MRSLPAPFFSKDEQARKGETLLFGLHPLVHPAILDPQVAVDIVSTCKANHPSSIPTGKSHTINTHN